MVGVDVDVDVASGVGVFEGRGVLVRVAAAHFQVQFEQLFAWQAH